MSDYYSNSVFPGGGVLLPQLFRRIKILPQGVLLLIHLKGISFISWTYLVKYLQIPVNASNVENFPFFTPKVHPRVCWFVCIILQLQRTSIENYRINAIDTINTIGIIDCINQYKDNQYDLSDRLTLQTSLTQLYHCCFLFRFAWLIKVRIIVVLQSSVILLVRSPLLLLLILLDTQS